MNTIGTIQDQKGYFIFKICMALIINAAINGAFGYVFGTPIMLTLGAKGILADCVPMAFWLGFFLTWFTILDVHSDLGKKKVKPLPVDYVPPKFFIQLSKNSIIRSVLFGIVMMATFGSAFAVIFMILQIQSLPFWDFVIVKIVFSMIMAFFLDPFVRITTLSNLAEDKLLLFVKINIYKVPNNA